MMKSDAHIHFNKVDEKTLSSEQLTKLVNRRYAYIIEAHTFKTGNDMAKKMQIPYYRIADMIKNLKKNGMEINLVRNRGIQPDWEKMRNLYKASIEPKKLNKKHG